MQTDISYLNTMIAQSCSAYRHLASPTLNASTKLGDNLMKLNKISQAQVKPSSEDIEVVSDMLFDFLPKVLAALSDDITNLLGFGLEVRAKVPEEIFTVFQDTLNHNFDFVQLIGKAARELKLSNNRSDKLHVVGANNIGRAYQDKRTQKGDFEIFYPNFPKTREIDFASVKKSFTTLSQNFSQFNFDLEKF